MVWDVLEAWGDDPPSHPVIHKSKGVDIGYRQNRHFQIWQTLRTISMFFATAKTAQTGKTANEGMDPPSFPAAVATKTAKTA